jgi:hypothetical protein
MTRIKKFTVITLLCVAVFGLNGCISIIEKINFKKDGSGEYELAFDMSSMITMLQGLDLGSMMGENSEEGSGLAANGLEKKDTVINMYDMLTASSAEIERADFWKKANMTVKIDPDASVFISKINFPFKKASDITYFYQNLSKLSENGDANLSMASGLLGGFGGKGSASSVNEYVMNKGSFVRKAASMNISEMEGIDEDTKNQMEMVKMFMASATYTTVYSFQKKVTKASNKASVVSDDKKTVTTEVSLVDMMEGKGDVSNEIKLK